MLDKGSEKVLELILEKDPETISNVDRDYLCARRSYLSDRDVERYGIDVLVDLRENGIEVPDSVVTREGFLAVRKEAERVAKEEKERSKKEAEEAKKSDKSKK